MPNWCSTTYTLTGERKDILKVWNTLDEIEEKAKIETDFGSSWLGHILDYLGMPEKAILSGPIRCRGNISYRDIQTDDSSGEITIETETAWSVMPVPFKMLVERVAPDVEIVYQAIEPGCEIYLTNDRTVEGTYLLDVWDSDDLPPNLAEMDYEFIDASDLKAELEKALGTEDELPKLIAKAGQLYGEKLSINQFSFCDIEDL